MKVFLAILSLTAYVKAISQDQVRCTETSMVFTGSQADFPRYTPNLITLGTCPLREDFSVDADYSACGLTKVVDGDLVKFTGALVSAPTTGRITRRKPVSFVLSCSYSRIASKTAGSSVNAALGVIAGDLTQAGNTVDLYLNLLDENGAVIKSGNNLEVEVGATVNAEVGGANLAALGLKAYATNCFVTPTPEASNPTRWELLKDSCPQDETFVIAEAGRGQKLSFESFAFTSDTSAALYLHCNLIACNGDAGCGKCSSRVRRSAYDYQIAQAIKTVTVEIDVY